MEAASSPGSSPGSDEIYRAAVGDAKAEYYVPKFLRFDEPGANLTSWNWPAFFVTFFWMLYRRMYGLALVYFLAWPIVLIILGTVAVLLLGEQIGGLTYLIVAIAVPFVVIPMYANALYHWHIKKRIAALSSTAPSADALVQRLIGQSSVAGAGIVALIAFVAIVPVIGILAAIAIPAYQDYTIRAQVTEGLLLAAPVKAAVTESFGDKEAWPRDLEAAGLGTAVRAGKYVESIAIAGGTILIRYGNSAHKSIAGGTLVLRPTATQTNGIEWRCGHRAGTSEDPASGAAHQTDIAPKYLPSVCRG